MGKKRKSINQVLKEWVEQDLKPKGIKATIFEIKPKQNVSKKRNTR